MAMVQKPPKRRQRKPSDPTRTPRKRKEPYTVEESINLNRKLMDYPVTQHCPQTKPLDLLVHEGRHELITVPIEQAFNSVAGSTVACVTLANGNKIQARRVGYRGPMSGYRNTADAYASIWEEIEC